MQDSQLVVQQFDVFGARGEGARLPTHDAVLTRLK